MNSITTTLYTIGGNAPGALRFKLTLDASQTNETSDYVSGQGLLRQETSPPLRINTFMNGQAVTIAVPIVPSPISQIITLTGYSEPLIVPRGRVNVKCTITMLIGGAAGFAQVQYLAPDCSGWTTLQNLPVVAMLLVPA